MDIVCRLCGFHTLMGYMGSIGSMMKGSEIEQAMETVYSSNVTHNISGKAILRALCSHMLIEAALVAKLIKSVLMTDNSDIEESAQFDIDDDIQYDSDAGARIESDSDGDVEGGVELNESDTYTELPSDCTDEENQTLV